VTLLTALVIAITAFHGGRIAERWITTRHHIETEELT
jgi:hypothetical protein